MPTTVAPDSVARRGRGSKRRKIDTSETNVDEVGRATRSVPRKASAQQLSRQRRSSPSATPARKPAPIDRPPDAPFHPGAIELWVVRDAEGKKELTSEFVPGCRHWRIGDPNVPFCFECKQEGDALGCRTCKRSYHLACLGERSAETMSTDPFYCPICIERGWDVKPPPEILPLTPVSSREASPVQSSSLVTASASQPPTDPAGQPQVNKPAGGNRSEPLETVQVHNGATSQTPFVAVNDLASPTRNSPVESASSTAKAKSLDSRAAAMMRTYDLQPPAVPSPGRQSSDLIRSAAATRAHRPKSRYQTMPDEVDQALTVIYRELESVTALRQDLAALQDRFKTADQARRMLEGLLALERQGHEAIAQKDAEIDSLKRELGELRTAHDSLVKENSLLQQRMQDEASTSKAGLEEVQALKASLRRLLGE
ncbi:hypothetical protein PV04_09161 [Phialophora macrospora]|uniref:PHD-type domain-containing protein n=1 Tax=Phialophora macrospora TaxID=1851006 RepID=A0A0D2F862_9EURO|nr:hypothetical protein PV04_09161 [Phialophora macrospora]